MRCRVSVLCVLAACVNFALCFRLSPPRATSRSTFRRCRSDEFYCDSTCVSEDLVCDGRLDCKDGSDESRCYYFPCPSFAFKCTYGACISPDLVCDGIQHCKDNSDENPYRCKAQHIDGLRSNCSRLHFACKSGECIDDFNLCDGKLNCLDGTDETVQVCTLLRCPPYAFRCGYGACINGDLRCDGRQDCSDGSDEQECNGHHHVSTPKPACGRTQFSCTSGECISDFDLCDGVANCRDASDETPAICAVLNCPTYAFQCNYGACINPMKVCNGRTDCYDGSDEQNCAAQLGETMYDPQMMAAPTLTTTPAPSVLPTVGEQPTTYPNSCIVPANITNGWNTVTQPDVLSNERGVIVVKEYAILRFRCNTGYVLHPDNAISVCNNNSWNLPTLPRCIRTCSSIFSSNAMRVKCLLTNANVPCSNPKDGTIAIVTCPFADPPITQYRLCLDGSWDVPLPNCALPSTT